jgi:hypothetical protein
MSPTMFILCLSVCGPTSTASCCIGTHDCSYDYKLLYFTGLKKGFLFKKKKIDNVWQNRFFVLEKDSLSYYKKLQVIT